MSQLPLEILTDIMSRLPGKSLARFRTLSTFWRSLIDSYEFLKLCLGGSIQSSTNLSLMLRSNHHLHLLDFNRHGDTAMTIKVDFDKYNETKIDIHGSSNGLLCFSYESGNLVLWNPLTGMFQKLPSTSTKLQCYDEEVMAQGYGFGYDSINDDYKVVKICLTVEIYDQYNTSGEVKVYSLKSNSWHEVESNPYLLRIRATTGVLVSNALHWPPTKGWLTSQTDDIVAFDLSSEEYRLVPLPKFSKLKYPYLQCLGGCLAVIFENRGIDFDIWVMKEYGVRKSWSKLVFMPGSVSCEIRYFNAVAYSTDGSEVLVHDSRNVFWFDLRRMEFKPVEVNTNESVGSVEMYQ